MPDEQWETRPYEPGDEAPEGSDQDCDGAEEEGDG
jgi:hypothetical protein